MSIKLLVNHAWDSCALVSAYDNAYASAGDASGIQSVVGGPRHLSWTQSGTGDRVVAYVDTSSTLAADTFVMVRADRHLTHGVTVKSWATWTSSASDLFASSNFAETLIGRGSKDYVLEFAAVSGKQALGVLLEAGTGGAYAKTLSQMYFASAFNLPNIASVTLEPMYAGYYRNRQNYLIDEQITLISGGLTQTQIAAFEALPNLLSEPVFLYESAGALLQDKLYHCIIDRFSVIQATDNLYGVQIVANRLRAYS